jgi:hypothetical protein
MVEDKVEKGKEKEVEPLAKGNFTGGPVRITKLAVGDAVTVSQTYIGVGPLLIPCTRGEQKALSGDVMVTVFVDNPDPTLDYEFIFLLSGVIAETILGYISNVDPPVTMSVYQAFLDERAARKLVVVKVPDVPKPAQTPTHTTAGSGSSKK